MSKSTLPANVKKVATGPQSFMFEVKHPCGHTEIDNGPMHLNPQYAKRVAEQPCLKCLSKSR